MCHNVGGANRHLGPTGTLQIGNRLNGRARPLRGGLMNFVSTMARLMPPPWKAFANPPAGGDLRAYSDGSILMQGTNTLSFTASSANTIDTNNVRVS